MCDEGYTVVYRPLFSPFVATHRRDVYNCPGRLIMCPGCLIMCTVLCTKSSFDISVETGFVPPDTLSSVCRYVDQSFLSTLSGTGSGDTTVCEFRLRQGGKSERDGRKGGVHVRVRRREWYTERTKHAEGMKGRKGNTTLKKTQTRMLALDSPFPFRFPAVVRMRSSRLKENSLLRR